MNNMKRMLTAFLASALLSACASSGPSDAPGKQIRKMLKADQAGQDEQYFEPSIERGMELLGKTPDGRKLLAFMEKQPVDIRYAPLNGPWPRYVPSEKVILIPDSARHNDKVVGILVGRGLTEHKVFAETSISDMLSEVTEVSALAQARFALELGVDQDAFRKSAPGRGILREVCAYLVEGQAKIIEYSRRQALGVNESYGRPYDTVAQAKHWLAKTNEGVTEGNLAQVIEKRNAERVRRKMMTQAEAYRQNARVRALDASSALRMQREYFFTVERTLNDMQALKDRSVNDDLIWRRDNENLLLKNVNDLTECGQYVTDVPDQDFEIKPLQ